MPNPAAVRRSSTIRHDLVVKPKMPRPVAMLGQRMQPSLTMSSCIVLQRHVGSTRLERHEVVRACTPLASSS
jgi:hypothetical protein